MELGLRRTYMGRLLAPNDEVEGPRAAARLEPRAHTVVPRPRRVTTYRSRSPPMIVRSRISKARSSRNCAVARSCHLGTPGIWPSTNALFPRPQASQTVSLRPRSTRSPMQHSWLSQPRSGFHTSGRKLPVVRAPPPEECRRHRRLPCGIQSIWQLRMGRLLLEERRQYLTGSA